MALATGLTEFGGGLLHAGGLATPLAALASVVVILNAIATALWRNGLWAIKGGDEYSLRSSRPPPRSRQRAPAASRSTG